MQLIAPTAITLLLMLFAATPARAQDLQKTLTPFFAKHCLRCHGPDEQEGQVRVDQLAWQIDDNDTAQRWQDLLDVLNSGDMPPDYEEQPEPEELIAVLRVLTKSVERARKRLTDTGGEIAMRRLNQREYAGTIQDLFGMRLATGLVPTDAESDSFDTVGADQYFTSSHFEQYLELNKSIVEKAFSWARKPRAKVFNRRVDLEEKANAAVKKVLKEHREKKALIDQGKSWKEAGFKDAGEMTLFVKRSHKEGEYERYLASPKIDEGKYLAAISEIRRTSCNVRADPRGEYRFRIHGGVLEDQHPLRHFVAVRDGGSIRVVKMQGTVSNPATVELTMSLPIGTGGVLNADVAALHSQGEKIDPDGEWAPIWIDYLEFEGPFYPRKRSFFERLLYPKAPTGKKVKLPWNDKNADELIRRFATGAFRRNKPSKKYVNKLVELFRANREQGLDFQKAITEPLAIVLSSPQFLFIQEATKNEDRRTELTDRELAIRLSYFLWSSPPDKTLYELAAKGKLSTDAILRQQVDRMLVDPKADAFFEGFIGQWVELDRFDAITVDPRKFRTFSEGLRHSARREVIEFFKLIVQNDLPADNLIDSDFVTVDPLLRLHYELGQQAKPDHAMNQFVKVGLPSDSARGGLLGQMAFHMLGSNGERSSPVIRGAWVMEKMLHNPPSPPPPNVPELGAGSKKPLTNREMVVLHQKQVVCSSCHRRMDVIGFGFENFDTIGRWRDTERVRRKEVAIEPGGTLPSGTSFTDVHELKALLMKQKHRLGQELCESMTAYGIGRTIEFSDSEKLKAILRKNWDDGLRVRSMIAEIVTSPLFRSK